MLMLKGTIFHDQKQLFHFWAVQCQFFVFWFCCRHKPCWWTQTSQVKNHQTLSRRHVQVSKELLQMTYKQNPTSSEHDKLGEKKIPCDINKLINPIFFFSSSSSFELDYDFQRDYYDRWVKYLTRLKGKQMTDYLTILSVFSTKYFRYYWRFFFSIDFVTLKTLKGVTSGFCSYFFIFGHCSCRK